VIHRTLVAFLGSCELAAEFHVELVEVNDEPVGVLGMDSDVWVVPFIGKERGGTSRCARSIVVSKFSEGKEWRPVVLLVVAKYSEVLLESLIESFSLSVSFQMVAQGEVNLHIQHLSEGLEEAGDKLGSAVAGDMRQDSVVGEYVDNE